MYDYDINGYLNNYSNIVGSALMVLMIPLIIICIGIAVVSIIGVWKVFTKAGQKGWKSIIPFYNSVITCRISGVSPWWVLIVSLGGAVLSAIPAVGPILSMALSIYFAVVLNISVAKSFGKDPGFGIGLWLLAPVFWMILGCNKDQYQEPDGVDPLGKSIGLAPVEKTHVDVAPKEEPVYKDASEPVYKEEPVVEKEVTKEKPVEEKEVTEEKVETSVPVENKIVNYCPNCGNKLNKDAKFCPNCGERIK